MKLYFNMGNVKALKTMDYGNLFNAADIYFTYSAYLEKNAKQSLLTRGFSRGCPIDEGYEFRKGDQKKLNDPQFIFDLPDLEEGQEKRLVVDLFCWESDRTSEIVKSFYTNNAAQELWKIYEQEEKRRKKAFDGLMGWLDSAGDTIPDLNLPVVPTQAAGWIAVAKALLPLLTDFIRVMKDQADANADDLVGLNTLHFFYKKENGQNQFRWLLNDGIETWSSGETDILYLDLPYRSYDDEIALETRASLKVMP